MTTSCRWLETSRSLQGEGGRFCETSTRNDKKTFQRSRDDKNGKSDKKCFRCGDPNHLIGECPKPLKDKNQRAFVGGSWSDSGEEDDEKAKDETCLMAQASSDVCSVSCYFSDENSSIDDLILDSLRINSFEASTSGTKETKFVKSQNGTSSGGGPQIADGGPYKAQTAPKQLRLFNLSAFLDVLDFGFTTEKSKSMYGREGYMRTTISSFGPGKDDEKHPNFVKLDKRTREKERILYGVLGTYNKAGDDELEKEGEWIDVEEPLDLVNVYEELVYESLIKEMPSEDDYDRGCERPSDLGSGFYKDTIKLGPKYQVDKDMKEWLIRGHSQEKKKKEFDVECLRHSGGGLILYQAYGNLYATTGRKAHLLEDKKIPSVGVFDEHLDGFGGNTHDLGSFEEETDKITTLHSKGRRMEMASKLLATLSGFQGDGVRIVCDGRIVADLMKP
ncbi:zf-CCHC domain-containing protein [Tanacetum coccineum]